MTSFRPTRHFYSPPSIILASILSVLNYILCLCFLGGVTRSVTKMASTDRKLLPSLFEFYNKQIEVDVCLLSQDYGHLWCHSIVAAANSPFIKQCVDKDPKGPKCRNHDSGTWTINIANVNINVLFRIVDYFYTGTLTITTSDVTELLLAATILQIDCLVDKLCDIVHNMLCTDNYVTFLEFSITFKLDKLQKVCHSFMLAALPKLLETKAIPDVAKDHFLCFVRGNTENAPIRDVPIQKWFSTNRKTISTKTILGWMNIFNYIPCTLDRTQELFDQIAQNLNATIILLTQSNVSYPTPDVIKKVDDYPLHLLQVRYQVHLIDYMSMCQHV